MSGKNEIKKTVAPVREGKAEIRSVLTGFTFKIVTPERVVFAADVTHVTLPTGMGEITVLPNHIPLVATAIAGEIIAADAEGVVHSLAVAGGFAEVHPQKLVVLADRAEMAHELDESRAAEAHKRAHDLLAAKAGAHDHEYAALKILMDKELARLKVARKYKSRTRS